MRLCRFDDDRVGIVRGDRVHDVTQVLERLPAVRYPYPLGDALIANLDMLRPSMDSLADATDGVPLSEVRLLSPVANPTKIIGTPQNYELHAQEAAADVGISQGRPRRTIDQQGLFLKANSALVGPSEGVTLRFPDRRTDHEAELGVIIGKMVTNVSYDDALDCVAGYCIAMDMVVRGPEDRSFRKSVDTYAVAGPWMVTADELPDAAALDFFISVNGEVRQKANTRDMVYDIPKQIAWASEFYTLYPGDLIMTGTCDGVSRVQPGDVMHLEFEGIGTMDVPVRGQVDQ